MFHQRRRRCLALGKPEKFIPNMDVSDKQSRTNQVGSNIVIRFSVGLSLKNMPVNSKHYRLSIF